jgi:hypothetical protein
MSSEPLLIDVIIVNGEEGEYSSDDVRSFCSRLADQVGNTTTVISTRQIKTSWRIKSVVFMQPPKTGSITWLRNNFPTVFVCVYAPNEVSNPSFRSHYFDLGANMVSYTIESYLLTLEKAVLPCGSGNGNYSCPYCGLAQLTADELWHHAPAHHINERNEEYWKPTHAKTCSICKKQCTNQPLLVHIHDHHAPSAHSAEIATAQLPVQLYAFSLVVCRHPSTGHYLLCQEFGDQGFWLPGGAVDAGETMTSGAVREAMEEAGVLVTIKGILNVDYSPHLSRSRRGANVSSARYLP